MTERLTDEVRPESACAPLFADDDVIRSESGQQVEATSTTILSILRFDEMILFLLRMLGIWPPLLDPYTGRIW